jgi:hypothetical protein
MLPATDDDRQYSALGLQNRREPRSMHSKLQQSLEPNRASKPKLGKNDKRREKLDGALQRQPAPFAGPESRHIAPVTVSGRAATGDRRSVDFLSALIPHAYPAAATAHVGSRRHQMLRHRVGYRGCPGWNLEQHSAGVQNDISVEEQIEEETRHIQNTMNEGHGRWLDGEARRRRSRPMPVIRTFSALTSLASAPFVSLSPSSPL